MVHIFLQYEISQITQYQLFQKRYIIPAPQKVLYGKRHMNATPLKLFTKH